MNARFFSEPELQFGAGVHVDVRYGMANYGPFDAVKRAGEFPVKVGIVGTGQSIEGVLSWLEKCRTGIPGKETRKPNLFPEFPGFGPKSCFRSAIVCEPRWQRQIPQGSFDALTKRRTHNAIVEGAVELLTPELEYIASETKAEVTICAPPLSLFELVDASAGAPAAETEDLEDWEAEDPRGNHVFHHLLKARGMSLRQQKPIQLVRPHTYGDKGKRLSKRRRSQPLQDEATRAWNFHTAIYYKARGVPWRLIRDESGFTTCYLGISFYRSLDESRMLTSIAQVFNERGDGVIVRGGQARISKDDKIVHLPADAAMQIVQNALRTYKVEHKNYPARLVVHKSSEFVDEERDAVLGAVAAEGIEMCDLLSMRRSFTRLFRVGYYPPLRGTCLELGQDHHVLYTRGSVDFFQDYPGMYIPRPLDIRYERAEQPTQFLAKEVLALTKMNWNNTQFDGGLPITLRAARQVGDVMKYVPTDGPIHSRYAFYM